MAKAALEGLQKVMDMPMERDPEKAYLHLNDCRGEIEINNISFSYADQHVPAIKDLSLKINASHRQLKHPCWLLLPQSDEHQPTQSESCHYLGQNRQKVLLSRLTVFLPCSSGRYTQPHFPMSAASVICDSGL
jgi:hypothetical protein